MIEIDTRPQVRKDSAVKVSFDDLRKKIRIGGEGSEILVAAEEILQRINGNGLLGIVYRWLHITTDEGPDKNTTVVYGRDNRQMLNLGQSTCFVENADIVLVAAYTAGNVAAQEAQKASENQDFLMTYILDQIGLIMLEKTGDIVKQIAEKKAEAFGWRVGPLLSPGSNHGWAQSEQKNICSLLPLSAIGVTRNDENVLSPLASLTCMIGIGTGYISSTVGTTCQVCSKRLTCEMQNSQ